jgi:two-component system NtrC family sensor kinase
MADKRILVVDDEQEVIDMLDELLTAQGYAIDSATSAAGALELVRANMYDAAIVDFALPDMNGVMLHRQIRQMDSELADHTLFTSGLVQSEDNMGYYAAYGSGFLAKPFDLNAVVEAVRKLWKEES